jgi:radical SAM superfamily enzyme YgiQ (UPF0313 family)
MEGHPDGGGFVTRRLLILRAGFERGQGNPYRARVLMEPLGAAVLAALTPAGWETQFCDDRCESVPMDAEADLVAISTCTFSALRAYQLADHFRGRGIPVVLGGYHPTLVPDEAEDHADAIVLGDADEAWPLLLQDLDAGRLQKRYGAAGAAPRPGLRPDRSIFRSRYLPLHIIQFGRGCRSRCDFCAIRAFYGPGYAHREIQDVVDEIVKAGSRRIFFVDDNLMTDVRVFKELMRALIPLKIRWSTQIDIGCADDPEVLDLMHASGCQSLTIGIESLHDATLKRMAKGTNHPGDYAVQLQRLRNIGIMIYGCFVFGYPQDTKETFLRTAEWAIDQKLFLANFMPLMPLPGTPLYERLAQEKRLVCEAWWKDPRFRWLDSLVVPESMSAQELSDGCRRARKRFNSSRGLLQRLWRAPNHTGSWDNLMVYLLANILGRRDRRAKYRASEG